MVVQEGKEADFDKFFLEIPAWFDAMEQDLGLRRIGTWRTGRSAVHLVESDRPYEQSIDAAKSLPSWDDFNKWQEKLAEFLDEGPSIMFPVQEEAAVEAEPGDEIESSESN
jgi:hypothetical protein